MPSLKNMLAAAAMAALAHAETITVTATSDDTFDPSEIKASKGDIIEFKFGKGNHSVVSGLYDFPCAPENLGTGFFSGFIDTDDSEADKVFKVKINSTEPIAFYSSVDKQCPEGMVGIINPTKDKTLKEYKEAASKLSSGNSPGRKAYGGDVEDADDSDDDSSSSSSKDDGSDDNDDDSNDSDSSTSDDKDKDDAAGAFSVPVFGLLTAVGIAFFMA